MKTRFAALLLATALLPAAAGCADRTAAAPVTAPPSNTFGGTDLAWIEITIAMNDQLLPLLNLVPSHSNDPELTDLSAQLQAIATTELTTLRRLHDQAGLPAENPHEGMDMPGLIPAEAVTRAAGQSGPPFDRTLGTQLRSYLRQSHRLAQDEQKAGTDPQTRALAAQTAATRESALGRLPA